MINQPMNTIAKKKLTSSSTRKASVTYDKPYEDHHLFMMWAESFAISSGTSSKMEASHEFIIAPSPSMWRHFACPCNIDKAIEQKILVHFSNHARQHSNLFFKPRDGITNSAAFLRVRQASHTDLIYHFFQSHAELPKSLAVTDVVGINRRLLLGSIVGFCWDRPSALAGIDRRLLLGSTASCKVSSANGNCTRRFGAVERHSFSVFLIAI
jgi:hypothetical protein